MPRQVYFDPFGSRLAGYRLGVQDETTLQDQTRRARASDYDYDVLQPLRTNAAMRADTYGQAALPYQIDNLGVSQRQNLANLAATELPIQERIGQTTGNYAPYLATAYNYGSGQSLGSEEFMPAQIRAYDDAINNQVPQFEAIEAQFGLPPGSFQKFLQGITGVVSRGAATGTDQFLNQDAIRQRALDQAALMQQPWERRVQEAELGIRQQAADNTRDYNEWLRNRQTGGAGTGTSTPNVVQDYF